MTNGMFSSGGKSLIKRDVLRTSFTSNFSGFVMRPSAVIVIISPPLIGRSSFRMTSGIKRADPFQDHEFRRWACCEEGRPTGYRRSHSRCTDLNRGCFGRYLQKNSTTRQIKFTRSLLETENCVCAESRYREVGESQFRARLYACAYSHSAA